MTKISIRRPTPLPFCLLLVLGTLVAPQLQAEVDHGIRSEAEPFRLEGEMFRFEDEVFRVDGRARLMALMHEATAANDPAWFGIHVHAMALYRELEAEPLVEPGRLAAIRDALSSLEAGRDAMLAPAVEIDPLAPVMQENTHKGVQPPPLVGRVVDAESGDPIPGITVNVKTPNGGCCQTRTTDANGEYSYDNLPAGDYIVFTGDGGSTPPWIDEVWPDQTCPGGLCDTDTLGQPITVAIGEPSPQADFALAKGGRFVGTLRDSSTMQPLESGWVRAFDDSGTPLGFFVLPVDDLYTIPSLPAGDYYLQAGGPLGHIPELYPDIPCVPFSNSCDPTTGQLITITVDVDTVIDFALDLGASISGTVTDAETGGPVTAQVWYYDDAGNFVSNANVASDGTYTLRGLLGVRYYLWARPQRPYFGEFWDDITPTSDPTDGTPLDLTLGQETAGIDFALDRGAIITGRLTEAAGGTPIAFQFLSVRGAPFTISGFSNGDGIFELGPVPPGTVYVMTTLNNLPGLMNELWDNVYCVNGCQLETGTPIAVVGDEVITGIDFALETPSMLRGRVTSSTTGLPIAGATIERVGGGSATAGGDGFWELAVGPGAHLLRVRHPDFIDQASGGMPCTTFNCPEGFGEPIIAPPQTVVENVDFALDPGGIVTGRVTSVGANLPLPETLLWFYDATGLPVGGAFTGADGTYRSDALPQDGTYYLNTLLVPDGFLRELWENRRGYFFPQIVPYPPILQGRSFDFAGGPNVVIDLNLDALSTAPELQVTLESGPGSGGEVESLDGWIACGITCSAPFPTGAEVTLDPRPDATSIFVEWSGDEDCTDGVVTLLDDLACTAHFERDPALIVFSDGFESGDTSAWSMAVP